MSGFGWLHLTDLHVRFHGTLWQRPRFREELERDLHHIVEKTGSIDVIIITGDLALLGLEGEFDMVTEGLASLCDFLGKFGSRPAVLAVPGNHDLVRTSPAAAADPASWEADSKARDTFFSDPMHPLRIATTTAFTPFSRWFHVFREKHPGDADITLHPGLLPGDFVATLQKKDRRFAFAGLNTAYLELAGHNAFGAIDLDPRQLVTSAGPLDDFIRSHDGAVLLTHHQPGALSAGARDRLLKNIAPAGRFALHLSGSLRGAPPSIDATHATLFVGYPFSGNIDSEAKRGYAAGRLDLDENNHSVIISLWPRILSFAKREPYFGPDPAFGPYECVMRTMQLAHPRPPTITLTQAPPADTDKSEYRRLDKTVILESLTPPAPSEDDDVAISISQNPAPIEQAAEKKEAEVALQDQDSEQPSTRPVPQTFSTPQSIHPWRKSTKVPIRRAKPVVPYTPTTMPSPPGAPPPVAEEFTVEEASLPANETTLRTVLTKTLPSSGISQYPAPNTSEPATLRFAPGMAFAGSVTTGVLPTRRVSFSPDGQILVFLYANGVVKTWNIATSAPGWTTSLDHRECFDICFAPDGRFLAVRSPEKLFMLDAQTGAVLRQTTLGGPDSAGLAWSPNGIIATGEPDGRILFFAAEDLASVGHLEHGFCPQGILAVEFSPDGDWLISGGKGEGTVAISVVPAGVLADRAFTRATPYQRGSILDFAFRPNMNQVASASADGSIIIFHLENGSVITRLEGHTSAVVHVGFSFDGRLLVSRAHDGTVIVWSTDAWEVVLRFQHFPPHTPNPVFSPTAHILVLPTSTGIGVELISLDIDVLLHRPSTEQTLHTMTAKVVLLGEGGAGKSCLALRLAEDRYLEQPPTHAMRFWKISADRIASNRVDKLKQRRELVVWDLAGQDEYRLVHPLFLTDTQLAILAFEPRRGSAAESEVAAWNDHLLDDDDRAKPPGRILVGTKVDDEHAPEDREAIERLRTRTGAIAYVATSARHGRGVHQLRQTIIGNVDWSIVAPTSRPVVFERIREHIDRVRQTGRMILPLAEIETEMQAHDGEELGDVDKPTIVAVALQLARQGFVALVRLTDGTLALVLHVEQIARYAGSLALLAKKSPHGVPAIEIASLFGPTARFPGIANAERLRKDQELAVLDGVIALLIERGMAFLHEGLLVFPGAFPSDQGADVPNDKVLVPAIRYEMNRPITDVYASAVAAIAMSRRFGPARLGAGRADFGRLDEGLSRISVETGPQGKMRWALALAFSPEVPDELRRLLAGFLEDHLKLCGVQFIEKQTIRCVCNYQFPHEIVEKRLIAGNPDVGCPECDRRTSLVPRQTDDNALSEPILALRKATEQRRDESVHAVQMTMTTARISEKVPLPALRILHLSDLHITAKCDPDVLLGPLLTDLRDRHEGLSLEKVDFVIISGDITNRASPAEFEKAHEVVSGLARHLSLSAGRLLIVPGNHDLDWDCKVYEYKRKRHVDPKTLVEGAYKAEGDGYLIRDEAQYPHRFRNFSHHFYHPLLLSEYPLEPTAQGLAMLFVPERLQFFLFNSAWEIDEEYRERSGLCPGAVSRALEAGNRQLREAQERGELGPDDHVSRLAIFHHPVTGNEKIHDAAFLEQFRRNDIRAVFHGHVHEERVAIEGHLSPFRHLHVVGAGSFGAPGSHRPEAVPRLYNLITISRDLQRMRIDTRCLRKSTGAWEAFTVYPGEKPGAPKRAYYEVELK
ncbi:MAG TPA: metallophosphoesterase [Polyangium sp.]|nr:metallophosphoesterase [Polyangium sp.]